MEAGLALSRRRFIKASAALGTFVLSPFQAWPRWRDASVPPSPCRPEKALQDASFLQGFHGQVQPGHDAFVTEKYVAELEPFLREWSTALCSSGREFAGLRALVAPRMNATPMEQATVVPTKSRSPLRTERVSFPPPVEMTGDHFVASFRAYASPYAAIKTAEFQISGIEVIAPTPLTVRTAINYAMVGTTGTNEREERNGGWEVEWHRTETGTWSLAGWHAVEESRSRLTGPGFVDITASCLGGIESYQHQLSRGIDYWRTVLDGASGIDVYGNNGIAAGDFDGDGFDDLYICQPAGLPNRLYRNRGDGSFEDVTEKAGVGVLDATASALFADFTNNGLQDLIVVRSTGPLLFLNRGDGTFEHKQDAFHFAREPQGSFTAAAVADYDRDGNLDIYFCLYSYYQGLSAYKFPSPYHDARNGPPNFLFRNVGAGRFEDVTQASGMNQNNDRYSFACGWDDFNNDGWPDLYVVNDFGRKNLYRNKGDGTFSDVSEELAVQDPGAGMSVCWFDYDNDGADDLYVANMWSAAGKRVTAQEVFLPSAPPEVRAVYRQHADGNSLFHNEKGQSAFRDVTPASGTAIGRWSWSSDSWDLDHDGFADLYVTNGFISGPKKDDLSSVFWRQVVARSGDAGGRSNDYEEAWNAINEILRSDYSWSGYERNNVYLNSGNGSFTEAAGILGLDAIDDSRSFALADLDHDGRLEVVLKNRTSPQVRILHNDLMPLAPSISFKLKGTRSNRDAVGAVLEIQTAAGRQRNSVKAGSGFLAQHSKTVFFGLGEAQGPVRATVRWPSGLEQVFEGLSPNHCITLEEGRSTAEAVSFGSTPPYKAPKNSPPTQSDSYETWLMEPLLAPSFRLTGGEGKVYSLNDAAQASLALVLTSRGCSESRKQLESLKESWPQWQQSNLRAMAVTLDQGQPPAEATYEAQKALPFPVLSGDRETDEVYGIFYRYLFDRRKEMISPTCFLLNANHEVVKVYSGFTDASQILADSQMAVEGQRERARLALPFPGHYFGRPPGHNFFSYGVAFQRYGHPDQAMELFQRAIVKDPNYAGSYYNMGLLYLGEKQYSKARVNLKKAADLDPTSANAWNNLGVIDGQEGKYIEAEQDWEQALKIQPNHVHSLENLVNLYQFQHRLDRAQTRVETAIAADPSTAELHNLLARILVERGDLPHAQAEFGRSLDIRPDDLQALNGLGIVLMRQGDAAGAKKQFERCMQLDPGFDRAYMNLALLDIRAGDLQQAHDILSGYLRNQHESPDVRRMMSGLDGSR